MKHTDAHRLPISQGHGSSRRVGKLEIFSARCNRCGDSFHIDTDWIDRYMYSRRNWLALQPGRLSPEQLRAAKREIDRTERRMRAFVAANADGALGRAADKDAEKSADLRAEIALIFRTLS